VNVSVMVYGRGRLLPDSHRGNPERSDAGDGRVRFDSAVVGSVALGPDESDRRSHTVTLLSDGRLVVIGFALCSARNGRDKHKRLGDVMNGFKTERSVGSFQEAVSGSSIRPRCIS